MRKILTLLFIASIISCKPAKKELSCEDSELHKNIAEYIRKVPTHVPFAKDCYSLHFFERNDTNYYTMWLFPIFIPHFSNYNYLQINDKDVFFVYEEEEYPIFLDICNKYKRETDMYEYEPPMSIYDGSWYPRTYRYYKDEKRIFRVVKCDTVITDFCDYPIEYYSSIEKDIGY